jgi:hypothetical protein
MEMKDSSSQEQPPIVKRAYEKPRFRYEHVFVTTALSCGKSNPIDAKCSGNPTAS